MEELSINDVNEVFVYAYDPGTDKNFIVKFLTPNSPGELFRIEVVEEEQIK